jgi:hydroxymethylglutaryl-CoA synthase
LFETLEQRKAINFYTYEKLHKKEIAEPVGTPQGFVLEKIEKENPVLVGARYYGFR